MICDSCDSGCGAVVAVVVIDMQCTHHVVLISAAAAVARAWDDVEMTSRTKAIDKPIKRLEM